MNDNRRKVGQISLLLMTFSAVFSFPSIINNSINIGLSAISGYLFASIFYFLPLALIIAEFASANGESESGIHSWIKNVLGDKWAFLGAWSYFFVNLFFFTSLVPNAIIYASYTILGRNIFDGHNMTLVISGISIIVFWLSTYVSIKGVDCLSKITNIAGLAKILMGLVFIIFAFIVIFAIGKEPAQEFTKTTVAPKFNWAFFMTMAWILQAVGGAESIGVYVKDVKGGNRAFVKTIIISTISICGLYILGCVAVGLIVPAKVLENNYANGIFDVFTILGGHFNISSGVITRVVGLILFLSSLGSLVIWTSAPVKVLFSEIPEGIFGKWLAKTDDIGTPRNALVAQAIVVTVLLIVPALGIGSIDNFLKTLNNMTASTALIPMLFLFISYIVLRVKKEDYSRNFKMGKRGFGIFMGVTLLILFTFIFFMSTVPDPALIKQALDGTLPEGVGNPILILIYNISGLVIFLGFASICWSKHAKKLKQIKG